MAKGKKTGGKDFAPGHSSPGPGRPPMSPELREFRAETSAELLKRLHTIRGMSYEELLALSGDRSQNATLIMIARWLVDAADGDPQARNDFLNRVWGKVTDKVEVSTVKPYIIQKRDGSQIILGAEIVQEEPEE